MDINLGRQPTTPAQYFVQMMDAYMAKKQDKGSQEPEG